jgi:hypothetical protein
MGETPVGECPGRRLRRRRHTVATGEYGARPSAGKRLAAATAERTGFVGDGY